MHKEIVNKQFSQQQRVTKTFKEAIRAKSISANGENNPT